MPAVSISMRKLKEILRLKYGLGLSHRLIARSLVISPSVVSRYALLSSPGGMACYDPYLIVVNLTTAKGKMMDYNRHATCSGEATAKFVRSPENGRLTVVIYDPTIKKNVGLNTIDF